MDLAFEVSGAVSMPQEEASLLLGELGVSTPRELLSCSEQDLVKAGCKPIMARKLRTAFPQIVERMAQQDAESKEESKAAADTQTSPPPLRRRSSFTKLFNRK
uniref:Uncharacterized protein n=1 Tax=Rhizochromulina marina TaxID=1034831 RepID=A0A7S2WMG4_9STRA|mmetsp:Transcript_28481/g.83256  ORF Transcript_28481/g.83256 Transcript_28481/m.83256 type:complete len:103 (+) Transcript_28481:233-541(+)